MAPGAEQASFSAAGGAGAAAWCRVAGGAAGSRYWGSKLGLPEPAGTYCFSAVPDMALAFFQSLAYKLYS